jgi:hypothetical protein
MRKAFQQVVLVVTNIGWCCEYLCDNADIWSLGMCALWMFGECNAQQDASVVSETDDFCS